MLARRVIPCLDVHAGQVTRGVQFGKAEAGELRNVGDPVELAVRSITLTIVSRPWALAVMSKNTISSAPWSL